MDTNIRFIDMPTLQPDIVFPDDIAEWVAIESLPNYDDMELSAEWDALTRN